MEPIPIGLGVCLSISDFKGDRYFHIRKYYQGKPTKFGAALSSNETIFFQSRMTDVQVALNSDYDRVYFGDNAWLTIGPCEITIEKNGKSVRVTKDQVHMIGTHMPHVLKSMLGVNSIDDETLMANLKDGKCCVCDTTVKPDIYGLYKCSVCIPPVF